MAAPSLVDFIAGLDPIAFTTITGGQLLQMVGGETPYTDKGIIVVTTDAGSPAAPTVPNASTTTKWQNYMWLRVSSNYVTAYVWNPNGNTDPTFLNWVTISSASIGPGSIQGYQIAADTITDSNIANVSSSKITGSVVVGWLAQLNNAQTAYGTNGLMQNTSVVFGDLSGSGSTVAEPVIGVGIVTGQNGTAQSQTGVTGKTALGTMTGANIKNNTLTPLQMASNGGSASTALTTAATDPLQNIIVPTTSIVGIPASGSSTQAVAAGDVLAVGYNATAGQTGYVTMNRALLNVPEPVPVTDANKILQINSGGTAYAKVTGANTSAFGRILQRVTFLSASQQNTSTNLALTGTSPTTANTALCTLFGSGGTMAFTPLSASSTLLIEAVVQLNNGAGANCFSVLFYGTNPVSSSMFSPSGANSVGASPTVYKLASPGTSAIDFYIYFAGVSGTTYINSVGGTATGVAALLTSWVTITEYI